MTEQIECYICKDVDYEDSMLNWEGDPICKYCWDQLEEEE